MGLPERGYRLGLAAVLQVRDVQARAADSVSSRETPEWIVVRYYGWRSNLFSIFPNALSVSPASGPDMRVIPWFNMVVLAGLAGIFVVVRIAVRRC